MMWPGTDKNLDFAVFESLIFKILTVRRVTDKRHTVCKARVKNFVTKSMKATTEKPGFLSKVLTSLLSSIYSIVSDED